MLNYSQSHLMEFSRFFLNIDITTIILALMVLVLARCYLQQRHLPPGPWGLPFVGVLFSMNFTNPTVKSFIEPAEKYGGIYCLRLGNLLMYILTDYEIIKEAYGKKAEIFCGESVLKFHEDDRGLAGNSVGEEEKQHRKFVISVLKNFGMGKRSIEPKILEQIHYFLREIEKNEGTPMDPSEILSLNNINDASFITFGERFRFDDEELLEFKRILREISNLFVAVTLPLLFPIFNYIPFISKFSGRDKFNFFLDKVKSFVQKRIDNHIETYNEGVCRDYIDAYLAHRQEMIENNSSEGFFDLKILVNNLMILLFGASETTTATLLWAMIYLILHPEVTHKVQEEIDRVIGPNRDPSMSDRSKMPFTEATLLEVHRCASIVPLSLMRKTTKETFLLGYRIPAGSCVSANFMFVHYNKKLWNDADSFKPERFINENGQVEKPEYLMPFSTGKCTCVGEGLAQMQLYLYLTSILQRFDLKPAPNQNYNFDCELKFSRLPKPFKICFVARTANNVYDSY